MSMNYYNTFIQVAPDCPVAVAEVPIMRGERKSVPCIQHELLSSLPYGYTQEEVLFTTRLLREDMPVQQLPEKKRQELWQAFFSRSHACLRASALAKRYGWGFHFNSAGKVALVAVESPAYREYLMSGDPQLQKLAAMRSKK